MLGEEHRVGSFPASFDIFSLRTTVFHWQTHSCTHVPRPRHLFHRFQTRRRALVPSVGRDPFRRALARFRREMGAYTHACHDKNDTLKGTNAQGNTITSGRPCIYAAWSLSRAGAGPASPCAWRQQHFWQRVAFAAIGALKCNQSPPSHHFRRKPCLTPAHLSCVSFQAHRLPNTTTAAATTTQSANNPSLPTGAREP